MANSLKRQNPRPPLRKPVLIEGNLKHRMLHRHRQRKPYALMMGEEKKGSEK
jgi:hypothetical protein